MTSTAGIPHARPVGQVRAEPERLLEAIGKPLELRARIAPLGDKHDGRLVMREPPEEPRLSHAPTSEQRKRVRIASLPPRFQSLKVGLTVHESVQSGEKERSERHMMQIIVIQILLFLAWRSRYRARCIIQNILNHISARGGYAGATVKRRLATSPDSTRCAGTAR
jgi:hypothetical protein